MTVRDIIGRNSVWIPNKRYDEIKPLISVLLPTYSRAESGLLKKCIDSVLSQNFRNLELIVVIDASTDGTFEICKHYMENDPRINIIWHKENIALPAISTYEAYIKARGQYVAYAFDDNVWNLDALNKTYEFMEKNNIKASYGITGIKDPDTGKTVELGTNQWMNDALWEGNMAGAGSVVLHREVLETVGLHDPHLSLTRVCDWDLWQRVCECFPFVASGIQFTTEYGVSQKDSLGNLFKLDQWFFRERQQHRNLEAMLPSNYLDVDVTDFNENNSSHYLDCLEEHLNQYREKAWFDKNIIQQIHNQKPNLKHRYILVVCADKTASIMNFDRYEGKNFTFCFAYYTTILHNWITLADAVVFARILPDTTMELCKTLSIPCYYFVDDNFREIAVEGTDDSDILKIAERTTQEGLAVFSGVVVSTPVLKKYFIQNRLHENVMVLSAIWKAPLQKENNKRPLTISFMGGKFRQKTFEKYVLPALRTLSKSQPLRLILPGTNTIEEEQMKAGEDNLEIIPVQQTANYEYLLYSYNKIGVDIFVHCGEEMNNNTFKTKNALINAVTLGAPLIVSDIYPYCDYSDGSEGSYLTVQNTLEAWITGLTKLSESESLRKELLKKATAFCERTYNWESVWAEFSEELQRIEQGDNFHYLKRYERLFDIIIKQARGNMTLLLAGYRAYDPENLRFSGKLKGVRRFGFTATKEEIRKIGLLFGITGKCAGEVELKFWKKNERKPVSCITLPIAILKKDTYTDILLTKTIYAKLGELLYVDVEVRYENEDGFIGLFEDMTNRTFVYKVFNKLGHPIPGRDAIFIDCRS